MSDSPEMRQLVFEVPQSSVEALFAHLGAFAVTTDISLRLLSNTAISSAEQHRRRLNPEMVSTAYENLSFEPVEIVTSGLLHDFAKRRFESTSLGERTANSLLRRRGMSPLTRPYLFFAGEEDDPLGIRAEKIGALTDVLASPIHRPTNFGPKCYALLAAYCQELYLPALQ